MKSIDLTGKQINRLKVIGKAYKDEYNHWYWECKCDCGNKVIVAGNNLRRGTIKSCGCWRSERMEKLNKTHGLRGERIYNIWSRMKQRCENPKAPEFHNYGGRGIELCEQWHHFEPFCEWAMANGYKDGLTIDRINNNGNYEPSNCRWTTPKNQCNNKRNNHTLSYNGETHTISEWAGITGINKDTLRHRVVLYGWSTEMALTTPARRA